MNRRDVFNAFGAAWALAALPAAARSESARPGVEPLTKSDEEWHTLLPSDRYRILREAGTEPSHSSPLNDEHRDGTYICAACYLPLFEAEHKFESGTGWPSFTQPIAGATGTKLDFKLVWPRTEYHCARCASHQGHVFDDGPAPRGERWCNNGLALEFVPDGKSLPELRS